MHIRFLERLDGSSVKIPPEIGALERPKARFLALDFMRPPDIRGAPEGSKTTASPRRPEEQFEIVGEALREREGGGVDRVLKNIADGWEPHAWRERADSTV